VTRKRLLWIAGVLAGLILVIGAAGVLVLRSSWFYEKVRERIVGTVEKATGGRVEIASLQFDWKQLRAEVKSFVIHGTEPADKPPLFRAASVTVGLKIVSALKRDVHPIPGDRRSAHLPDCGSRWPHQRARAQGQVRRRALVH